MQARKLSLTALVLSYTFLTVMPALARDLVYQPISPSFGGSPLNGPYVLGLAGANNRFTENPAARRQQQQAFGTPSDQFREQITASLLSQIAANIGQQIIGENARDSGTFNLNGTVVNFNRIGGQIRINIHDGASGGRTDIEIPVPKY